MEISDNFDNLPMIPLTVRPAEERRAGVISVTVPSRGRREMLTASIGSLREHAARPELLEIMVAYDPDDPDTAQTARELGADLVWEAPERFGFAGQVRYYAALLERATGEWCWPTWSDDAVMTTPGWDDIVRAQPPGSVIFVDGNWPGGTCFPVLHMDVLTAVGRLCPLPTLDTWFQDAGREAGILVQPGIYVRQDRPDLNGLNDDQTHREGGGAWRSLYLGYDQPYFWEPYVTWRVEDAAAMRGGS